MLFLRRHVKALVKETPNVGWHVHPEIFHDTPVVCFTQCSEPWALEAIEQYCADHEGEYTIPGALEVFRAHMEAANHAIPELREEGLDLYKHLHCECEVQSEHVRGDLAFLVESALEAKEARAVPRIKKK